MSAAQGSLSWRAVELLFRQSPLLSDGWRAVVADDARGEARLGILPQGSAPAKVSDADAGRMLAGAASRVPSGETLADKGWAREALPAGEAVRIWVAMKGPEGVSVMHSIYLPGEPAIGFVFMSHMDSVAPPEALIALARSYARGP